MNIQRSVRDAGKGGDDFIPARDYISDEFAELERERLWPRVWQMVCREEEIPNVGHFVTYDIVDDSIVVIRTGNGADEIKAFHNACPHRGRRLTEGCGHIARFHCRFHGWQFDRNGRPAHVVDRDDWGQRLQDDEISLIEAKVGRWGGWVYINMDPESESLQDALAPAAAMLDPFDIAGLRYHYRKSTIAPCNWKTALEAFSEGYHVQQTHRQILPFMDDYTSSYAHGRHGVFGYWESLPPGYRSRRLGGPNKDDDFRDGLIEYFVRSTPQLKDALTLPMIEPVKRVRDLPAETSAEEVLMKFGEYSYEDAVAQGITYPQITAEELFKAGADWHLFPNQVFLQTPSSLLGYRVRPNGHDVDSCIFEIYSLLRYPHGAEPKAQMEWSQDFADESFWGKIISQDLVNLAAIQQGMKSRGFRGSRPNPKQEVAVSNFHRALYEFMDLT